MLINILILISYYHYVHVFLNVLLYVFDFYVEYYVINRTNVNLIKSKCKILEKPLF